MWGIVEDVADGEGVHRATEGFVGGVDADGAAVAGGAGVDVDAIVGANLGRVFEFGERYEEFRGAVIEDDVLVALERIGVEEEPLAAGDNSGIEIDAADFGDTMLLAGAVVFVDREVAAFEHGFVVEPGMVAGDVVEVSHVLAVG